MISETVVQGIVIGAAGGAVAGLVVWLVERLRIWELDRRQSKRVHRWLDEVTRPADQPNWRSTRAMASFNNLTEDRIYPINPIIQVKAVANMIKRLLV